MKRAVLALVASSLFQQVVWAAEIIFTKEEIFVGEVRLQVEIAKSSEEQARGLMFRKKLDEMRGMLFVYSREQVLSFWMKNTFVPLSIGFFNKNRELIDVQDMTPVTSEMQVTIPSYRSTEPAMYALEVNQGWFGRHKIKLKTKIKFSSKVD